LTAPPFGYVNGYDDRPVAASDRDKPRRSRFSYANVVATVALFFALGGGALAASHYLITKTSQIKPNVLRVLFGKRGPTGPAGAAGTAGTAGATGATGATGPGAVFGTNSTVVTNDLDWTELAGYGPYTFYGQCYETGGGSLDESLGYELSGSTPVSVAGWDETAGNITQISGYAPPEASPDGVLQVSASGGAVYELVDALFYGTPGNVEVNFQTSGSAPDGGSCNQSLTLTPLG
jgi:hypothetical protein